MGQLDQLRGDDQRRRRRPGLHRPVERGPEEARLHLRGSGGRCGDRNSGPQRRPVRPRVGRLGRGHAGALPERGRLRVSLRLLPVSAACRPDAGRAAAGRWTAGDARRGEREECRPGRGRRGGTGRRHPFPGALGHHPDLGPAVPGYADEQLRATGGQPAGPGAGGCEVLPAGRDHRRPGPDLLHLHPGRNNATGRAAAPGGGYGNGRGQIWAYDTQGQFLELLYESPSKEVLDFPDNVTTSRSGSLVLCEDGGEGNFLRGLTPNGILFDFAQNAIAGQEDNEFAGSTFSPDFHTLFVNIQSADGLSFAIWGPWALGGFR
ncbi:MAG: alkaline phosphatase PhoX [Geodermatophilaceae bacterium]